MKFSVIIPVYNVAEYIEECILSVLNQTFADFEVILVDDGSNDNSLDICRRYEELNQRITVYSKKNEGVISTRRFAAQMSHGDYIVNLDGDDLIDPNLLLNLNTIAQEYNPDAIFFNMEIFDSEKTRVLRNKVLEGRYIERDLNDIRLTYMYSKSMDGLNSGSILPSAGGKAIKRELYIFSIGEVPTKIFHAEDLIQNQIVLSKCNSIYISDNSGYKYRTRASSASKTTIISNLDNIFDVYDFLMERYPKQSNQIAVYTIIQLWNTVSSLAEKNADLNDIKKLITKRYKSYSKVLRKAQIGRCSFLERIKVFIVSRRLWTLWKLALQLKH